MKLKITILITMALLLGGCISLLPDAGPGPDIYRLSKIVQTTQKQKTDTLILLPLVQAPRELKNNRVALITGQQSISYAANARWASSTPEMLQVLFADALRNQPYIGVVYPTDGIHADFEIRIILQNFEAVYDQGQKTAPIAKVQILVRLIDRKTRTLVTEKTISSSARSSDVRLGSIVAAIDQASHNVAIDMSNWVGSNK
ncbi:MAG: ABC-type transport auxiliary lipoprotein family protein [Robiginitomaculum sp.]|nr:ABC-type transport auxiliary lipoprotein family protein [Robiginitomaculum sp.]